MIKVRFRGQTYVWILLIVAMSTAHIALGQSMQTVRGHLINAVPLSAAQGDLGPLTQLQLTFVLPLRNQSALDTQLARISDPTDAEFRKYLTPDQFTQQFGPTEGDYQAVIDFAVAHKLAITGRHPNRMLLDVSGTTADVQQALHLKLRTFKNPYGPDLFYAPDSEPSLDLKVPLLRIEGLDSFHTKSPMILRRPYIRGATPQLLGSSSGLYDGRDFRSAYAPGVTLQGTGQSVGIYAPNYLDGIDDVEKYEDHIGLTKHVTVTDVNNVKTAATQPSEEVTLDISMAIAMAPGLSSVIVYHADNFDDAFNHMATDDTAKQLSLSWSGLVPNSASDQIFKQMQRQGQSFFHAAGDDGVFYSLIRDSPYATPQWSDDPNIMIVGGTELTIAKAAGAWTGETVWHGTGGGWQQGRDGAGNESDYPGIPSWQSRVDMSSNNGSTKYRNVPDVSMVADNVYLVYQGNDSGDWSGTSIAAPLWAGFTALINQQAANDHRPTVGFINPLLYELEESGYSPMLLHDVISGDNTSPNFNKQSGNANMYKAVKGYDLCTGWGTPIGNSTLKLLADGFPSVDPKCLPLIKQEMELDNELRALLGERPLPLPESTVVNPPWEMGAGDTPAHPPGPAPIRASDATIAAWHKANDPTRESLLKQIQACLAKMP